MKVTNMLKWLCFSFNRLDTNLRLPHCIEIEAWIARVFIVPDTL